MKRKTFLCPQCRQIRKTDREVFVSILKDTGFTPGKGFYVMDRLFTTIKCLNDSVVGKCIPGEKCTDRSEHDECLVGMA